MNLPTDPLPVVTVGGAGKILGCSTTYVRWLDRKSRLTSVRLENGVRIFVRADVEQLARERAAAGK